MLDVTQILARAVLLGDVVTTVRIPGAMHDVTLLSEQPARARLWTELDRWLAGYGAEGVNVSREDAVAATWAPDVKGLGSHPPPPVSVSERLVDVTLHKVHHRPGVDVSAGFHGQRRNV